MSRQLRSGVQFTIEPGKSRRTRTCSIDVERIIANGKFVGTLEHQKCGRKTKVVTCTKKKVCTKGYDLVWLLDRAGMRVGERRR